MKIGTKSVLFGAHAFWLHPWFVAAAWWKLYGFPTEPWLWIAFFVHDLGYWGKPNMDGPEGERHPYLGAQIMAWLEWKLWKWRLKKRITGKWSNEVLFHSRYLARQFRSVPSDLCWADKLATALIPWWIYLPMTLLTGEIHEYIENPKDHSDLASSYPDRQWSGATWSEARRWFHDCQAHMRLVVTERRHAA